MDTFLLMGCVCDSEHGQLKAFKDEHNLCSNDQKNIPSSPNTSPKTHRTPVADRTRSPKKVPQKPRKNKDNTLRDFRLSTVGDFRLINGADIVRALTFD
jgi:hypothetical protein